MNAAHAHDHTPPRHFTVASTPNVESSPLSPAAETDISISSSENSWKDGCAKSTTLRDSQDTHDVSILDTPTVWSPGQSSSPSWSEDEQKAAEKQQPAKWSTLPRKGQLILLTMSRLSEPLSETSLQAYMFYQLRSFDPSLSDAMISSQAGILQASFTATQALTAVLWGRVADSEKVGRKFVIMTGLLGTMISAIGFGFSKSFATAMFFRCLGGSLNGNVGVMRTVSNPHP